MTRRVASRGAVVGVLLALGAFAAWLPARGYFWPRWVWFGLGAAVAAGWLIGRVLQVPAGARRWLVADGALLVFLTPVEITVWLLSARGFFWPVYSLLTLSVVFGAHVWYTARRPDGRERELTERVDTLTRTRRGVVDSQADELRRIERDLHDGAQARMVSAALSIGIAQNLMQSDPDAAARALIDARSSATGAIADLRGVMHNIYPAVLSDRGLGGGVRALAYDVVIPVTVEGDPPPLPAAAEAAVYFAVAECLTNAVKHGDAAGAKVRFRVADDHLVVEVHDDGAGGAIGTASTAAGGGTGLRGLRDRLAAFDGGLTLDSPPGGPTTVTIRVPLKT